MQEPIGSGFTAASTASDVLAGIDLGGKVAIVTGGYAGIGLETARALRAAGATVIVPARDLPKATRALHGLDIGVEAMDLLDPASIDAFAARFLVSGRALHILVNSAGIMACPLARDARGHEAQFATNHLGHFQLVARLRPALRQAQGARVVSVSSWGHRYSPMVLDDPDCLRRPYERWSAYGQSKTANILFAVALDRHARDEGVRAFSLHPGSIVSTDLKRHLSDEELRKAGVVDERGNPIFDASRNLKTAEQGASTSVWCATAPQLDGLGGLYCENTEVARVVEAKDMVPPKHGDSQRLLGVMPYAIDPATAEALWSLSERLTS